MKNTIEKLRIFLFVLDLKETNARGEVKVNEEEYLLQSSLLGKKAKQKALEAKMQAEVFKVYLNHIITLKNDTLTNLKKIISTYEPRNQTLWYEYFISQMSVSDLCEKYGLEERNCYRIIAKMKKDFEDTQE